ncbi:MAG: ABC transporter permease [Bacteroidaceae bacterium]|nr:ABC transporter permease [Bacteroidaceae bacterium]
MIEHNFKLAWRQLVKYRLQSLVSIVSLAIGFACFAFASVWIRYETTYDAFHKDAENIYVVTRQDDYKLYSESSEMNLRALNEFPEFELVTCVTNNYVDSINERGFSICNTRWLMNDTNLVDLFGLDILEGSTSFVHNGNEIAISDRLAKSLWGEKESAIGKPLTTKNKSYGSEQHEQTYTVTAVFRSWGEHSNFMFDMLMRNSEDIPKVYQRNCHVLARVYPNVNVKDMIAKFDSLNFYYSDMSTEEYLSVLSPSMKTKLVPLTELYYSSQSYKNCAKFKFNHIYLFSIACGLLILCSILNYLTMFINRLFIRKREIALRTVFGASGRNLMTQFLTEYGLLLVIALLVGLFITFGFMEDFLTLADLNMGRRLNHPYYLMGIQPELITYFTREVLLYASLVFTVSMFVSLPFIWYFRRQSLQSCITGVGALTKYNIFRYASTTVQMGISIFCIFCTVVLQKQLDTLRYGDIGFEYENRLEYEFHKTEQIMEEEIIQFLRSCPEVDTLLKCIEPIFPTNKSLSSGALLQKKYYPELTEDIRVIQQLITVDLADFYGLELVKGRWPHVNEYAVAINEAFAHQMGWENPLNKVAMGYPIVGVVKDFYNVSPLEKAKPYILFIPAQRKYVKSNPIHTIVLRYKPGMKQELMSKIEEFYKKHELRSNFGWDDLAEYYNRMLKSEDNLRLLLSITTTICIMVALFGVWSMIMLTCEQRRKEIAIRKVYGATTKDILDMFIIEYMTLQGIAAIVAFPIGYACMKPWLEQYVVQTEISWWIYVGIFLMVALLVALCVGWRVWKTAKAKPADEIE